MSPRRIITKTKNECSVPIFFNNSKNIKSYDMLYTYSCREFCSLQLEI